MNTRKTKIDSSIQRRPSIGASSASSEQTMLLEELKTLYKDMKEDINAIKRDMSAMRKEIKQEIRQEIRSELKVIKETLGKATEDITRMEKNIEIIDDRTNKINKKVLDIEKTYERELDERALQELKLRENCIKIRGLKEKENEDLFEYLVPVLAEYIGEDLDLFQREISKMFRINSKIAKQRKLPRDVVIYFTRKKIRDDIIQLNYEEKLEIDGEELIIYKDIPLRILKKRNDYKPLVSLLKNNDLVYKWDRLEGVIFKYKSETFRINSIMKMKDFMKKHKRELEKRDNVEEVKGKKDEPSSNPELETEEKKVDKEDEEEKGENEETRNGSEEELIDNN